MLNYYKNLGLRKIHLKLNKIIKTYEVLNLIQFYKSRPNLQDFNLLNPVIIEFYLYLNLD